MSEKIHIDSYWRSLNKKNEELCGDRVQIKRSDSSVVLVLADGLGSGVKANILSTLTSTIVCEMVFSGMNLKEAIETISSTLPVCAEREIAYSTFTIIQIYYDGAVFVAQYDSPSTIFIHNGKVVHEEEQIRTYSGKTIHLMNFLCEPGDYILTFSDGVLFAGLGMSLNVGWGQKEVETFLEEHIKENDSASDVTRMLLSNVNYLYGSCPGDDSTVACLHILEAKETKVMVGPPSNKEDDEKVVHKLLAASGKKICCGGTTSTIVSRVTGKELKTDSIFHMALDVPPKGFIDGIDLVTEGVLTLQKVSRMLKKAVEDTTFAENVILSHEQDGATCLMRELLQSSAITFMVGLSDNPAHEEIAYSTISLNAKIALIKDMAKDLETLGKIVKIEMY